VILEREEYIEQAYFFRAYRERIEEGIPAQQVLSAIHEEILATTRLPMAIEFLRGEIVHHGRLSEGMKRLAHYFTAFQAFVMSQAEDDRSKLDQRVALELLQKEAEYRAGNVSTAGLFVYQFESICRNKLGYEAGLLAVAADPMYDAAWSEWIKRTRLKLGAVDFGELIWFHSEQWMLDRKRHVGEAAGDPPHAILFGARTRCICSQRSSVNWGIPRCRAATLRPAPKSGSRCSSNACANSKSERSFWKRKRKGRWTCRSSMSKRRSLRTTGWRERVDFNRMGWRTWRKSTSARMSKPTGRFPVRIRC
jgi:hypothetical protein